MTATEELPGTFAALWLSVQPSECGWGLAGSNLGVLACIQIRLQTVEVLRASPLLTVQPLTAHAGVQQLKHCPAGHQPHHCC